MFFGDFTNYNEILPHYTFQSIFRFDLNILMTPIFNFFFKSSYIFILKKRLGCICNGALKIFRHIEVNPPLTIPDTISLRFHYSIQLWTPVDFPERYVVLCAKSELAQIGKSVVIFYAREQCGA